MPNCSQAKCNGHNSVSVYPRQCPDVAEPTCANGYPPLKVPNDDGCCYHYQCQCELAGRGQKDGTGSGTRAGAGCSLRRVCDPCPDAHRCVLRLGRPSLRHLRRHLLHVPEQLHLRADAADHACVWPPACARRQLLLRRCWGRGLLPAVRHPRVPGRPCGAHPQARQRGHDQPGGAGSRGWHGAGAACCGPS